MKNNKKMTAVMIAIALAAVLFVFATGSAGASDIDVVELSVKQAADDIKNKKYTSKALTEAYLARIAKYNPGYNAIITMNPDALKEAEAIDRRIAAGEPVGPLAGVPFVIKDTIDIAGLPSTGGWKPLSARAGGVDLLPEYDAPVVARLRAAGAVLLGKTNVPVMSLNGTSANNSWAGPTFNAASPLHAPGASSSGTATAVSGSMAAAGLAEETGGSIQNPAAAQALVSVKPTFALIPNTGVIPIAGSTRDVVGPHARTVYDAALIMDVLAGYTSVDAKTTAAIGNMPAGGYTAKLSESALKGKRIGLYGPGWRTQELSDETKKLYAKTIEQLKARGAIVVEDPFADSDFAKLSKLSDTVKFDQRGCEYVPYDFQNYLARLGGKNPKTLAELAVFANADAFSADGPFKNSRQNAEFMQALKNPSLPPDMGSFLKARDDYMRIFNEVMDGKRLDALVFPQMYHETPLIFGQGEIGGTTVSEINIGGFPGVTVPAGYFASGAPFSVIFVGRLWDEANLLALAYDFEQATKMRKTPQLLEQPMPKN